MIIKWDARSAVYIDKFQNDCICMNNYVCYFFNLCRGVKKIIVYELSSLFFLEVIEM